jgi:hypothetical protein
VPEILLFLHDAIQYHSIMCRVRGFVLVALAWGLAAQENVDLNVIHRIKNEAFKKGKVAEHLQMLTDRYGPRLTASPEYDAAAEWVTTLFKEWGLANVHLEKWGPFGRSWSLRRFSAHMTAPQYAPLVGLPLAWSPSTPGTVTAEVVVLPLRANDMEKFEADIAKLRKEQAGKLRGKVVMITSPRTLALQLQAAAKRYTDPELAAQAAAPDPVPPQGFDYSKLAVPEDPQQRLAFMMNAPRGFLDALRDKGKTLLRDLHEFLRAEGVAALFVTDRRSDGGQVFGESAGWYESKWPSPVPTVTLTPEHYGRIARLVKAKTPVKIEMELKADTGGTDVNPANVVAEIPGGAKSGEVVIVGAHLDSWHGGTGATDNASGSAVAMEAVRILKALNLKLDRTVRIVLWSGEEGIREGAFRRPEDDAGPARTGNGRGVLQPRQRQRQDPRRVPSGQRRRPAGIRPVAGAI